LHNMKNKVIWYLFDSDKGAGKRAFELWDKKDNYEFYSIGLSTCNTSHFKSVDLSKYQESIDNLNKLIENGELKKPDIILASPPCEAWSLAKSPLQAFIFDKVNNKFIWDNEESWLKRKYKEDGITPRNKMFKGVKWEKIKKTQEIGIDCIKTTKMIIDYYKPNIYLIENGRSTFIWKYIKYVLNWDLIDNIFDYGAYGWIVKKPTRFNGNILLTRKRETKEQRIIRFNKTKIKIGEEKFNECRRKKLEGQGGGWAIRMLFGNYAERSDIPTNLLIDIYNQINNQIVK